MTPEELDVKVDMLTRQDFPDDFDLFSFGSVVKSAFGVPDVELRKETFDGYDWNSLKWRVITSFDGYNVNVVLSGDSWLWHYYMTDDLELISSEEYDIIIKGKIMKWLRLKHRCQLLKDVRNGAKIFPKDFDGLFHTHILNEVL